MLKNKLHDNFCSSNSKMADWYCKKLRGLNYPIYSSFDIRDSGFKISNVDGNIYPAGFNNICNNDRDSDVEVMKKYLADHYGNVKKVLLITEEHTQNPYYWDNIYTIRSIFEEGGIQVLLAFPRRLPKPLTVTSSQGHQLEVHSGYGDSDEVKSFAPDLVVSNNDFSESLEEWAKTISLPINPPRGLGWFQRKKHRYFHFYNELVVEFCEILGLDPFLLNVKTEVVEHFDIESDQSLQALSAQVDKVLGEIRSEYSKRNISEEPFVFVKNNSGTYGLAVVRVGSGKEILEWNYKSRKKMKAAKGGRDVEDLIIQEGISTRVRSDNHSAEPVIYMIGSDLAGGFLRTHEEKSATESLNSPGAVYKRLCVSDLNVSLEGHPLENVYGWSARLGLMAIAHEAREMKVEFEKFKKK